MYSSIDRLLTQQTRPFLLQLRKAVPVADAFKVENLIYVLNLPLLVSRYDMNMFISHRTAPTQLELARTDAPAWMHCTSVGSGSVRSHRLYYTASSSLASHQTTGYKYGAYQALLPVPTTNVIFIRFRRSFLVPLSLADVSISFPKIIG